MENLDNITCEEKLIRELADQPNVDNEEVCLKPVRNGPQLRLQTGEPITENPSASEGTSNLVGHTEAADSSVSFDESKQIEKQLHPFSRIAFIGSVLSVGLFVFDVFTDIWTAKVYYDNGMTFECILTVSVVVAAFLVTGIINAIWLRDKTSEKHPPRPFILLILTFPFATIERTITYIYHGCRSKKRKQEDNKEGSKDNKEDTKDNKEDTKDNEEDIAYHYEEMISNNMNASLLKLFDAFIESAPQLLLQIYLILKEQENLKDCENISIRSHTIRLLTVLASWMSVAYSVTDFYPAHRVFNGNDMHKTKKKKVFAVMGYFLWRAFEIGPRVIALVMIFLMNGIIFAITVAFHWIVMVMWSFVTKTSPYKKKRHNVIFILFVGFVQIFSFMNVSRLKFPDKPVDSSYHTEEVNLLESSDHTEEVNHDKCYPTEPRHHALLYYLFVYTENIAILISWMLVKNSSFCPWIYHWSIRIVSSGLIFNIVFMISYYKLCHPTTSIFVEQML
ncbi:XK-related protein 9-like [Saccostrea cucullata]|uniref:XK-related protein 9-like n=1 Tax=Saccostrea cuccullata TaxID=36930 RepID=UPI002ED5C0AF